MRKWGWYRLLVLCLLLTISPGCRPLRKRARWEPPLATAPMPARWSDRSSLRLAESAYAEALEREIDEDPTCVDCFFEAATLTWPHIESQIIQHGAPHGRPAELYHSALTKLITAGQNFSRLDPKRGLSVRTRAGWATVPMICHRFLWSQNEFDYLIPVGDYSTKDVNESYRNCGLGVATVVVHCRRPHERFRRHEQVFSATVVLRPVLDGGGSMCGFSLELFDPLRNSSIALAGRQVALESDITAPLVYSLSQTDRDYVTRFLQPGSTTADSGLFMIEPYQPGKIPVVFVHGLLSDPFTWANLANEIRARPELLQRYQIWGYEYATGEPFLTSAAVLRQQLRALRAHHDPVGSDIAISRTLLIGHSMGGLISKLQVTYSGTQLWESVSNRPLSSVITTPATRKRLAEAFFFEPSPMVSRVVFVGTPHRGSPWATRPIGRLGSSLVNEPSVMQEEHQQLTRDNPDAFSGEFERRIPTSVDLLDPDSALLGAIDRLPYRFHVQLHSLVGSGYRIIGAGDSDTVVPVASARKPGVVTERMIRAKHGNLHKSPEGINEILSILGRHVAEFDAALEQVAQTCSQRPAVNQQEKAVNAGTRSRKPL